VSMLRAISYPRRTDKYRFHGEQCSSDVVRAGWKFMTTESMHGKVPWRALARLA